jgi:hypothetical protein
MKPKNFLRLTLLVPYILWGICLLIFYLTRQITSAVWDILLMPVRIYTFGIILWFIPYTLLALGLLIWSRNKSTKAIYRIYSISPFLLLIFMILESIVVSMNTGEMVDGMKSTLATSLSLGGLSLIFGYVCVGIAIGLYKLLQTKNFIKEETMINNELSSSET